MSFSCRFWQLSAFVVVGSLLEIGIRRRWNPEFPNEKGTERENTRQKEPPSFTELDRRQWNEEILSTIQRDTARAQKHMARLDREIYEKWERNGRQPIHK